jgi:hypothetical protein
MPVAPAAGVVDGHPDEVQRTPDFRKPGREAILDPAQVELSKAAKIQAERLSRAVHLFEPARATKEGRRSLRELIKLPPDFHEPSA